MRSRREFLTALVAAPVVVAVANVAPSKPLTIKTWLYDTKTATLTLLGVTDSSFPASSLVRSGEWRP
jgi:hypothetical protein